MGDNSYCFCCCWSFSFGTKKPQSMRRGGGGTKAIGEEYGGVTSFADPHLFFATSTLCQCKRDCCRNLSHATAAAPSNMAQIRCRCLFVSNVSCTGTYHLWRVCPGPHAREKNDSPKSSLNETIGQQLSCNPTTRISMLERFGDLRSAMSSYHCCCSRQH